MSRSAGRGSPATRHRRTVSPPPGSGASVDPDMPASTSNARAQNARPAGAAGAPVTVGPNAQQQDGEIAERARERMVGRPPLVVPAHARGGQRLESLDALSLVGHPQAERKRGRRRRRRIDRVVQIRQTARRTRQTAARTNVSGVVDRRVNRPLPTAERRARHQAARRVPDESAGRRRMRQKAPQPARTRYVRSGGCSTRYVQRLIVESGETATEQRRAAIGKNRDDQLIRRPPHDERPRGSRRQTTTGSVR